MDGCELFIRALLLSLFRWPVLITSCRRWNRFFVSQLGIIKRKSNEFLLLLPPPSTPSPFHPPSPPPLSCASGAAVFQLEKRLIATHQSPKKKVLELTKRELYPRSGKGGGEEEEETRTN